MSKHTSAAARRNRAFLRYFDAPLITRTVIGYRVAGLAEIDARPHRTPRAARAIARRVAAFPASYLDAMAVVGMPGVRDLRPPTPVVAATFASLDSPPPVAVTHDGPQLADAIRWAVTVAVTCNAHRLARWRLNPQGTAANTRCVACDDELTASVNDKGGMQLAGAAATRACRGDQRQGV